MNEKMSKSQFSPEEVSDSVRALLRKAGFTSRPAIPQCSTEVNGENTRTRLRIDMTLSHAEMKMLQRMASGF